jgi:hypothetical protein
MTATTPHQPGQPAGPTRGSVVRPPFRGTGTSRIVTIGAPEAPNVPMASRQGALALRFGDEPEPLRRPALHLADDRDGPERLAALRAELDAFATRFCSAVVEGVGGDRGPQQLLRWTTPEVYEDLVRRCAALAGTTGSDQRLRRLRAQVRSVHLFCPLPDVAELSVHVRHGQRSRAIAARLEHDSGRWTCVALQFG